MIRPEPLSDKIVGILSWAIIFGLVGGVLVVVYLIS